MAAEWLVGVLPFIRDSKVAEILREHVRLLEAQRDDAIRELDKADAALADAKKEITGLKRDNAALDQQVKNLQPKTDLPADSVKILRYFFKKGGVFTCEHVARQFDLQYNVAKYHCDRLEANGFVVGADMLRMHGEPIRLKLSEPGIAFIVETGLA